MSRIITENYIVKLNSILDGFDYCENLKSLIDFFEMQIKIDQSKKGSENQKLFSERDLNLLQQIQESSAIKRIISYLDKLINSFDRNYMQIHLNIDLEDSISNLIVFFFTWDALINSSLNKSQIRNDIKTLESELNRDLIMPSDNNKHRFNQIVRENKGKRFRKYFLEKLLNLTYNLNHNGWLININKGDLNTVHISEFSKFPKSESAYINNGNSRKCIFKEMGRENVENISNILNLFPSLTGNNIWYKDFMSDEINRYNNFKKVITITSGEKTSKGLSDMYKQNKFQSEEIYTIFRFEIEN